MDNTKIPNNVKTWPAMDRDEEQTVWPTVLMELLVWLDVGNGTVGQPSVIFFSFPSICGFDCVIVKLLFQREGNGKETTCSLQAETQAICVRNTALLHD